MAPTPPPPDAADRGSAGGAAVNIPAAFKLIWAPAIAVLVAIEVWQSPLIDRPVLFALVALTILTGGAVVLLLGSAQRGALTPAAVIVAILANATAIVTALVSSAGNDIAILAPLLGGLLLASVFEGRRLVALFGIQWGVGVTAAVIAYTLSDLQYVPNKDPLPVSIGAAAITSLLAYSLLWWVRFRLTEALRASRDAEAQALAAEAATQAAADTLRSFITASPLPAIEVATDGLVRFANPAAEALLDGIPLNTGSALAADPHGEPRARRIPPEWAERALLGDAGASEPAPLLLADGRTLQVEVYAAVERSAGSVTGLILQVVDVTDREAMAAKRATADRLEAVGRMAGGIAHDFNNLLTAVGGHAELLAEDLAPDLAPGDPRLAELDGIRQATSRGADLVQRLLMFSRRERLAPVRVDAGALVAGMEPMLSRVIGGEVQLAFRLDPVPMPVMADPVQLEQVLLNLVINARDAMPAGGTLTVRTAIEAAVLPGAEVEVPTAVLEVSDTGEGMDEETLHRAFEPFFTTKAGRGTGLGLTTALSIVRGSGGALTARSRPGDGTAVRVLLPLAGEPPIPADDASPSSQSPTGRPAPGHERLLVIDDEPAIREIARRHLGSLGYDVAVADGTASALASVRAAEFDLVLSDVVMPEVRGPELASRLRAERPALRVVFMTGYAETELDQAGAGGGGVRVLSKPFDRAQLALFVRTALDEAPTVRELATARDEAR